MTKIRDKQQLIDAAEKVFRQRGYNGARLEDIAAELGMLQGSLYYHVGSKAGLLRLVLRQRFAVHTEHLEEIVRDDGLSAEQKLGQALAAQFSYTERHLPDVPNWFDDRGNHRMAKGELEHDRELLERFMRAWQDIVRTGIEEGAVDPDVDASLAVLAILGGCSVVHRRYEPASGPGELAKRMLPLLWRGLAARPAQPSA